jgi:hypothetical protein
MKNLSKLVDQLESEIPNFELTNSRISSVNVGWHIEHSCLVIVKIIENLQKSDASTFKSQLNIKKLFVFLIGKIPRGGAKAPSSVLPLENRDKNHLLESIEQTRHALIQLNACGATQYFTHPIFGNLHKKATIHFLWIHTKHHLQIIKEINLLN